MTRAASGIQILDLEPAASDFLAEAIAGLSQAPRTLPSKFFYDELGADLFLQICELPEYYVTRTETDILQRYAPEMAASIGANAELVGFGTGAGIKTRMLLEQLENPIAYVPVDISKQRLIESNLRLVMSITRRQAALLVPCAPWQVRRHASAAIAAADRVLDNSTCFQSTGLSCGSDGLNIETDLRFV